MRKALRSFVEVPPGSDFPLDNLPFGVFRAAAGRAPRVGVAIGEQILDLSVLEQAGVLDLPELGGRRGVFSVPALNPFLALGRPAWRAVRERLQALLDAEEPRLRDDDGLRGAALVCRAGAEMLLPAEIGDVTDFYSSLDHATNVGTMIRGADNALQENWRHLPIGYHGRASSVVVSGTDIRRPLGQSRPDEAAPPIFGPSRQLDFELEVGFLVGPGNRLGERVPIERAAEHIFGFVLVNDWSARDVQRWEYVPLGPFLSKSFATSISPWVVTLDALEPLRGPGAPQDPEPLPYLRRAGDWTLDVTLEVWLRSAAMERPQRITVSNMRHLYWDPCQQLAHHTVNGCNLRPGDLLASGTVSGPTKESRGCLLELTWRGSEPLALASGETRRFLEDGDRVTITGFGEKNGVRIGFGEVSGTVLPAAE